MLFVAGYGLTIGCSGFASLAAAPYVRKREIRARKEALRP